MDIIKKEKGIKIEINKNPTIHSETLEKNFAPVHSTNEVKKERKFFNSGNLTALFFLALVFLMPIFVLPLGVAPIASSKAIIFYGGILLITFFFILSALQKKSVKIPKSALLISCGAIVLVWLVSALFSNNVGLSLFGKLYDLDTFSMIFAASLALFFGSIIFHSEKMAFVFYFLLFCSSIIVFLFQFFHLIFGINLIPFSIFPNNTSNLIGSWNDFSIFFGLIGLLSLVFLETAKLGKGAKILLYVLLLMSFSVMTSANFFYNWVIFGIFSLLVFMMVLYKKYFSGQARDFKIKNFIRASLFAIIAIVFFILASGVTNKINNALNVSFTEVRPSLSATLNIAKKSLKNNAVLGTGPNTFLYSWLNFKPAVVNNTIFWNARFGLGFGHVPSMMATTGILGIIAIIFFLAIFLNYGRKVIFYKKENALTTASFFGAAYLWTFIVLHTPGILVFAMAFILTGVFLARLSNNGKIGVFEMSLPSKTKSGIIFLFIVIILLTGIIYSVYIYSQKFLALNNYSQALALFEKSGDISKTSEKLMKAVKMDKQDEYYRVLSELGLISLSRIASNKDISADKASILFRDNLGATIAYAQEAVKINPADPVNWMQLGRVYESVVFLNVDKADEAALNSYAESFKVSPLDPLPFVSSARVAMQTNKVGDARKYIELALNIKPDFADALFMLSQIEAQAGNLKEAILRTEQTANVSPNNFGVFFQLGLLQYQNNNLNAARAAFERAVGLNNDYANARYFLGLIYDKQGLKEKAVEQFTYIQKTNPDNEEVKKILSNLKSGRNALAEIAPPAPEDRSEPPISEKKKTNLNKSKKN